MSIILKEGSGKVTEIVPSGTHIGRCYKMVHVGTVEWTYLGETKWTDKVSLTFELPHETRTFDGEEKPMVISKEYTVSLHEKSNLRKDLESWRGASFTPQELNGFDLESLLGQPCNVSILQKMAKNGNEYANVVGLGKLTKGVECPPQFNENFIFDYKENFNKEWVEEQPPFIKDKIMGTEEWESKMNQLKFADTPKDNLPF